MRAPPAALASYWISTFCHEPTAPLPTPVKISVLPVFVNG